MCVTTIIFYNNVVVWQGFNISDKVLVLLNILLEWRHLSKRSVPIAIAIQSKLDAMVERVEVKVADFEIQVTSHFSFSSFFLGVIPFHVIFLWKKTVAVLLYIGCSTKFDYNTIFFYVQCIYKVLPCIYAKSLW